MFFMIFLLSFSNSYSFTYYYTLHNLSSFDLSYSVGNSKVCVSPNSSQSLVTKTKNRILNIVINDRVFILFNVNKNLVVSTNAIKNSSFMDYVEFVHLKDTDKISAQKNFLIFCSKIYSFNIYLTEDGLIKFTDNKNNKINNILNDSYFSSQVAAISIIV